jgi:flagellar biosynthesis protein FlhG
MSTQLESLRRYVADRAEANPSRAPGRVLLVGSGKGGVGTSTVAALVAVMAATDGEEVLLVDADESHGALPLMFGAQARAGLAGLRAGTASPADLLVTLGHGLALLPLGGTADPDERLSAADRRGLLRRVASLYEGFDLVVIDAGSRLEQVLGAAAGGASRLLAVTAAERVSAAATYALVKTMEARFPGIPVDLLFNRCRMSVASNGFEEMEAATRHFLARGLEFAGAVPEDERLRTALAEGVPLQDAAAFGSPATTACHELAVTLVRRIDDFSPAVVGPRLSLRR